MNTFAERLKYAMEQADLKQSALSEQAGISKAAISQYLSGKNTPNQERIKALADVMIMSRPASGNCILHRTGRR